MNNYNYGERGRDILGGIPWEEEPRGLLVRCGLIYDIFRPVTAGSEPKVWYCIDTFAIAIDSQ